MDETLASVRAEAGHRESELALADAFAAMNRAYLTVHTATQESFAQKAQAFSTAIQNWDGIWLGELRLPAAEREEIARNYAILANRVAGLTPEEWRRYQLTSGATTFRSAAQSFRKWWQAHQCEIIAVQCTIGFLAILGFTTASAISSGGSAGYLALTYLGGTFFQSAKCLFNLWVEEC